VVRIEVEMHERHGLGEHTDQNIGGRASISCALLSISSDFHTSLITRSGRMKAGISGNMDVDSGQ
jgi:hypothetical protein